MLQSIGYGSMDSFIDAVVPQNILEKDKIDLEKKKPKKKLSRAKAHCTRK